MTSTVDKLISRRRACEVTGLSKNTLVRLEQRQLFPPHLKVGARVLYSLVEVLDWVRQRKNERSTDRPQHHRGQVPMIDVALHIDQA